MRRRVESRNSLGKPYRVPRGHVTSETALGDERGTLGLFRIAEDVFLTTVSGEEIFLNNRLRESARARRCETVRVEDWDG